MEPPRPVRLEGRREGSGRRVDGWTDRRPLLSLPPSLFHGVLLEAGAQWVGSSTQSFPLGMMSLLEEYIKMHQKNILKFFLKKRKKKNPNPHEKPTSSFASSVQQCQAGAAGGELRAAGGFSAHMSILKTRGVISCPTFQTLAGTFLACSGRALLAGAPREAGAAGLSLAPEAAMGDGPRLRSRQRFGH